MNAAVPDPSKVLLLSGGEDGQDLPKKLDKPSGRFFVLNVNWRVFLGHRMFGLPRVDHPPAFEESMRPRSESHVLVLRPDGGARQSFSLRAPGRSNVKMGLGR